MSTIKVHGAFGIVGQQLGVLLGSAEKNMDTTWRVGGLSKWVVSRLVSTPKGNPNWGYGTYKSLK